MNRAEEIAHEILHQHSERRRFRNLAGELSPRDDDEAYAAQFALHHLHQRNGRGIIGGRKIALSSAVQQELCGIDHPVAGGIFKSEILESPATVQLSDYYGLGIEFELAFEIGRDITKGDHDASSIRAHIGAIRPALELIIDREADYSALDARTLIADNAWSAGVVLGRPIEDWQDRDIDALACELDWSGEEDVEARAGAADPLGSLAWVANLMVAQGQEIGAGEIVITGSVIRTRYPKRPVDIRYTVDGNAVDLTIR